MTKFSDNQINVKIVHTKKELNEALSSNAIQIVIEDKLAERFRKTEVLETVDTNVLSALAGGIPRKQTSERLSVFRTLKLGISTGLSVGELSAITSIGIGTVIEIYRDYDVEFNFNSMKKEVRLIKI